MKGLCAKGLHGVDHDGQLCDLCLKRGDIVRHKETGAHAEVTREGDGRGFFHVEFGVAGSRGLPPGQRRRARAYVNDYELL